MDHEVLYQLYLQQGHDLNNPSLDHTVFPNAISNPIKDLFEMAFRGGAGAADRRIARRRCRGHPRRRQGDRRHKPHARGRGEERAFSRGSVLPAERSAHRAATAAGARRGYSGTGPLLRRLVQRRVQEACSRRQRRGDAPPAGVRMARQHPRAAQRRGTCHASRRRRRADRERVHAAAARASHGLPKAWSCRRRGSISEQLERSLVVQALERSGWNQTKAATLLGLNRDQIRYRIEKFKLERPTPS